MKSLSRSILRYSTGSLFAKIYQTYSAILQIRHLLHITEKESFLEDIEDIKNQMIYAIENRYVNGIEIVKEISDENSNKAVFPVVFTSMLRSGSDTDNEIYYPENMKEVYALSQTPQVSLDHQVYNRNGKIRFCVGLCFTAL